ncbi:uncharacterized protein RCC_08331 [Ramularia collo-cygni]|uniref:Uncharacterized protein n=1 Tax=Ramularia collo-cygni TaxID=112498 RepID=A0A2D3UZV1_9PEZI|nr:uncharacterized protein RCC_08331 [Ramularia collo-cygni]CZT22461.1 uncharacterized protein RCC_08331 [Ramularia collo-cygni]
MTSQAFNLDFVRVQLDPYFYNEQDEDECNGKAHNNDEQRPTSRIEENGCHTENLPFKGFIYDIMTTGFSRQKKHGSTCDLLFYQGEQCTAPLVWALENVNHPTGYCHIIPGYTARSVRLTCRPNYQPPAWKKDMVEPALNVNEIPLDGGD